MDSKARVLLLFANNRAAGFLERAAVDLARRRGASQVILCSPWCGSVVGPIADVSCRSFEELRRQHLEVKAPPRTVIIHVGFFHRYQTIHDWIWRSQKNTFILLGDGGTTRLDRLILKVIDSIYVFGIQDLKPSQSGRQLNKALRRMGFCPNSKCIYQNMYFLKRPFAALHFDRTTKQPDKTCVPTREHFVIRPLFLFGRFKQRIRLLLLLRTHLPSVLAALATSFHTFSENS